ncbi:MAG: glycoside hydrolase family 32 protein, partial [Planctomycetota bacterium]
MRIERAAVLALSVGILLAGARAKAAGDLLFDNSDFEKGTLENWTAEGDAFTRQPTKGDNPKARRKETARLQGEYWIGTFENYDGKGGRPGQARGDKATGTLTSVPFIVKKRFIVFRVGGGSNAAELGVRLLHDGKETTMGAGRGNETMGQVSFDASRFLGREVRLVIYDSARGGWGHINVDDFRASDTALGAKASVVIGQKLTGTLEPGVMDPRHRTFASYMDVGYDQPFRAQFHFSSRKNWLNDPNGMVYYDGEYHLYFQHHALGLGPGPKSWGHAVSRDLVHWKQLPHAILPYSNGAIWSGTAVVDRNNSLGKQVGDTKTIVAYYTKTQPKPKHFIQSAAYSTDRGRTFTLIRKGEAVVPNQGFSHGERDPKAFWHEESRKWIMVLILG